METPSDPSLKPGSPESTAAALPVREPAGDGRELEREQPCKGDLTQGILSNEEPCPGQSTALIPIDPELLAELPVFEQFFKTFGFKRMHGRVWGLLVLSAGPLSAKEITEQLGISQGAVSTTLGELDEWGATQSRFDPTRRCHLHGPVGNALQIAATILRRREQVAFQHFHTTAERALAFISERHGERDPRVLTLRSIISACEIADALMKLLVGAVANALGDSQSILSRAIGAAFRVGLGNQTSRAFFEGAALAGPNGAELSPAESSDPTRIPDANLSPAERPASESPASS